MESRSLNYLYSIMNKRITCLLFIALMMACSENKKETESEEPRSVLNVSSGRVERLENFESQYVSARNVDIWLPKGYSKDKKYNVLYMHDGQMLYDSTSTWNKQEWKVDEIMSELIGFGTIPPTIVVGAYNGGAHRHADYFPQKPYESLDEAAQEYLMNEAKRNETELFAVPVRSDGYLKFLVEELKPYIDSHYSTNTGRESTFVAGSSMGGLISWYAICEYPEVFGGAACLSTHWPGTFSVENNPIPQAFIDYLKANLPDPASHKIYFDFGTETLDALYEPFQIMVDDVMLENGWTAKNWMSRKFQGEDHSERAWQKRLDIPVTFLMEN